MEKVSVIQLLPTGDGERARLGHITELPPGAEVQICGTGFNERTVKVLCNGHFYFAFSDNFMVSGGGATEQPKRRAAGSGSFE